MPSAGNTFIAYRYVPVGSSGTMVFTLPTTSVTQTYEFRYLLNDGYSQAGAGSAVSVTGAGILPVSPSAPAPTSPPPPPPPPASPPPPPAATPTSSPTPSSSAGPCPNGQEIAFPGAEGFGRCAQGGRGGRVIEVTNLNNEGPGSLRECAEEMSGPRTCVFKVSGTIALSPVYGNWSDIVIKHDYITIDGSTAPGGGIALKDGGLAIQASHVIVRHLRVRPGSKSWDQRGVNANGIMIMAKPEGGGPNHNIIVDHCTTSWGTDDMIFVIQGTDLVTVQWTMMYEALECATCGGKGLLVGYGAKRLSFHHNYYGHTYLRWPEIMQGDLDFVNNVAYDHNGTPTIVDPYHGAVRANFVGNYFKDGPNAMPQNTNYNEIRTIGGLPYSHSSSVYVQGNIGRYRTKNSQPENAILWQDNGGVQVSGSRFDFPPVHTTDAFQAVEEVLTHAGAFPRDSADTRVVQQYRNGTGIWPPSPAAVGGWPLLTGK